MWFLLTLAGFFITLSHGQAPPPVRLLNKDPTYIVVTPRKFHPDQTLRVPATLLLLNSESVTIRASIRSDSGELASGEVIFYRPSTLPIIIKIPADVPKADFIIRVTGFANNNPGNMLFEKRRKVDFDIKQASVFIITNRPQYKQGQRVYIRAVPIGPNLMSKDVIVTFRIFTPSGNQVRFFPNRQTPTGGVIRLSYILSADILEYGTWRISGTSEGVVYNKYFKVGEWYQDMFVCNVSMSTYLMDDAKEFKWRVHSIHIRPPGRPTKGSSISYIDIRRPGAPEPEATFVVRKYKQQGGQNFKMPMSQIKEKIPYLAGRVIKVTAHIREWYYNITSVGHQSAFIFPSIPHLKFLGGSITTFKPYRPFTVNVAVVRADGSPIGSKGKGKFVQIRVTEVGSATENLRLPVDVAIPKNSIVQYTFTPSPAATQLKIAATYDNILDTETNLRATRFHTTTDYFLRLETTTTAPKVQEYIIFSVTSNIFVDVIYYHIIAAGNVITSDVLPMNSMHKVFSVALSREMCPSARVIAYFITPEGQIVGDSLHFHVSGIDKTALRVFFNQAKDLTLRTVELNAWTEPLSLVAFSGLLTSLYRLGARNGLTYPEVYEEIYKFDNHADTSIVHNWLREGQLTGTVYMSSKGHANDMVSLFYNSGLFVFTDAEVTSAIAPTECRIEMNLRPCFIEGCFHIKLDKCNPDSLACPKDQAHMVNCDFKPAIPYDPVLYGDPFWRLDHIVPFFPAGMFVWTELFTRPNGRLDSQQRTMGPPKGWAVSAFTLSTTKGLILLPEPIWYGARRTYQMGVRGPPSMRMKEQAGMRVVFINRWKERMDVLIIVHASPDYKFVKVGELGIVSAANPELSDLEQHILLPINNGSFRQIYVPITPTRTGWITVRISGRCAFGFQNTRTRIHVSDVGIREGFLTTYQVDMRKTLHLTLPDLRVALPEYEYWQEDPIRQFVPGSRRLSLFIHGSVVGVTFFPHTDYRLSASNILRHPYACGEQTLFNLGFNVQVYKYERTLGQIVGGAKGKIIATLNNFMQEVYAFANPDGSFREFRWSTEPSLWVTAFAGQVLVDSSDGILDLGPNFGISRGFTTKVIRWLANRQDNVTGEFKETSRIYNRRMVTGLMREDSFGNVTEANAAMTAHVVITLIKSYNLGFVSDVTAIKDRALDYLESLLPTITDPFEMAIVQYCFTLDSQRPNAIQYGFEKLDNMSIVTGPGDKYRYWSIIPVRIPEVQSEGDTRQFFKWKAAAIHDSYATAATAYVLLAYLQAGFVEKAQELQEFLQMSRRFVGGFASTQDTLIALEGLRTLTRFNLERSSYGITYNITSTSNADSWYKIVETEGSDFAHLHSLRVPTAWGNVHIEARGFGIAQVQMSASAAREFRELLRVPPAVSFKYTVGVFPRGFNHSILDYKICGRFNGEAETSGVVVLAVGIPSGYNVDNRSLHAYVRNNNGENNVMFAYFYNQRVNMYYHSMNHTDQCVRFTAVRWYPVAGIAERQVIRFAELYEAGHFRLDFYRVVMLYKNNVCNVCASYQCPYCPLYAKAKSLISTAWLVAVSILVSVIHRAIS